MVGYWLSTGQLADILGMRQSNVHRRLTRNAIPGRKRAKGKGLEYDVSAPTFFADWRGRIEANLGRAIPIQDCDEAPQPKAEKGFRIVIEVRFEEL